MPIMLWDGKILLVDNKIALHEDCCCEEEEVCNDCTAYCASDTSPCNMSLSLSGVGNGIGGWAGLCDICSECNGGWLLPFVGTSSIGGYSYCEWSGSFPLVSVDPFTFECDIFAGPVFVRIGIDSSNTYGFGVNHYVLTAGTGQLCETILIEDLGTSIPDCSTININRTVDGGIQQRCLGDAAVMTVTSA